MNDYLDYQIKTGGDGGGDSGGSGCAGGGCFTVVMGVLFVWAVITGFINLIS